MGAGRPSDRKWLLGRGRRAGLAGQTYDAFAQQYSAYLARTTQALNAQAPAAYTPDLSLLDGLLRTLRVTATSRGAGRRGTRGAM